MKNSYLNYSIDIMILITGLLCGITGIIKWPGLIFALGLSYQGLPLDAITSIHDWTGLLMILFVVLHVAMHLKWLVTMTKRILRNKAVNNEKT
jgi:cytochrome b561